MDLKKLVGRRVALIGGGGFIGHNMAMSLHSLGAHVDIIDSLQVNNLYAIGSDVANRDLYLRIINQRLELLRERNIPIHLQDARDHYALGKLLESIKPHVVVQLAAVSHANKSNKDPYSAFDHSFLTLENALEACRGKVEHFIFFSSSMVYGHFNDVVVTEETACNPIGIYGALKYSGEKLVIAYGQVFQLPYTIVRPSALYGERCVSRRVGQIFLENAVQGRNIAIHGDGTDKLDFTYVEDLIQGIVKIIDNPNAMNQTFNITYGRGREIREMAQMVMQHFPTIQVEYLEKESLTPDRGTLSIDKARKMIGYEPEYPLEVGYGRYIDWYKRLMVA